MPPVSFRGRLLCEVFLQGIAETFFWPLDDFSGKILCCNSPQRNLTFLSSRSLIDGNMRNIFHDFRLEIREKNFDAEESSTFFQKQQMIRDKLIPHFPEIHFLFRRCSWRKSVFRIAS